MTDPAPCNIAAHLPEMARRLPEGAAIHVPWRSRGALHYHTLSFLQLEQESNRIAHALEAFGIGRGVRTVLMVTPGREFFALTFALFKVGAVPVLIDPGMGVKNLKVCMAEADPQAFIGIPKAHLARLLLGWGKGTLQRLLTVGPKLGWGGASLARLTTAIPLERPYAMAATDSEETAAILFTSGSTGTPKGAVYSHGNFCTQVEALRTLYGIRPGEIDLPTFPLFALFAPALGMTAVIPEMDFTRPAAVDPQRLTEAIRRFGVTSMFGSPALINRVGRFGAAQGLKLPSLKRVISAGAPVPAAVLERFAGLLPQGVEVFTPYGSTEALPVCSIGSAEILAETRSRTDEGLGVCIGRPVPGLSVEIIAVDDAPIHFWKDELKLGTGEIGEIVVRGGQVTRSYFNRPASTDLAKILDPVGGGFYHRMGDLGYRDQQGRLWFCGRKTHRVVTPEATLLTIPTEAIFNTHGEVYRTALVGVGRPGAQTPVLCVELEAGIAKGEQARIRAELLAIGARFDLHWQPRQILFHPAFPVDIRHNAKIFREQLAVWAAGRLP